MTMHFFEVEEAIKYGVESAILLSNIGFGWQKQKQINHIVMTVIIGRITARRFYWVIPVYATPFYRYVFKEIMRFRRAKVR